MLFRSGFSTLFLIPNVFDFPLHRTTRIKIERITRSEYKVMVFGKYQSHNYTIRMVLHRHIDEYDKTTLSLVYCICCWLCAWFSFYLHDFSDNAFSVWHFRNRKFFDFHSVNNSAINITNKLWPTINSLLSIALSQFLP